MLYLRESFLYRVEIRRVGRQVDEKAAPLLDELPYPLGPVSPEVVHNHDLTRAQRRGQQTLHVGLKYPGRGRPFHGQRWSHPSSVKACKQRRVLAAVSRNLEEGSLTYGGVSVKGSQGGVSAHRVDEYQAPGIDAPNLHAPEHSQELVSFCRPCGSFFRLLRRHPTARQTVASLTLTPDRANRNSALWEWVAHGDRKSTRLNSSHANISYAVFCLKKKKK